jgi:hypothetical protein
MSGKQKIRKINRQIAEEERLSYTRKLTPEERIGYLKHLREVNMGNIVNEPLKKVIKLIPPRQAI